jgi:hypothetical protein
LFPLHESDRAGSHIIGVILITFVTIILVIVALVVILGFQLPHGEAPVQTIFKITNVVHTNFYGKMTRESYVVLTNIRKESYRNRYLSVKLYVNDIESNMNLPTLNGDASCSSLHNGVQNIGGIGSEGNRDKSSAKWYPDQSIWIDFSDGTFGPGDTIRIEVYDGSTGKIISRDTWPEQKKYTTQWFYNHFLNRQSA